MKGNTHLASASPRLPVSHPERLVITGVIVVVVGLVVVVIGLLVVVIGLLVVVIGLLVVVIVGLPD